MSSSAKTQQFSVNLNQLSWLWPHTLPAARKRRFFLLPVYMQVKQLSQSSGTWELSLRPSVRHKVGVGGGTTTGSLSHRWSLTLLLLFECIKNVPGLCVPESPPTRGAHKVKGTWLICRQTGGKTTPMILPGTNHSPSKCWLFYTPNDDLDRNNGFCLWSLMNEKSSREACCIIRPHVGSTHSANNVFIVCFSCSTATFTVELLFLGKNQGRIKRPQSPGPNVWNNWVNWKHSPTPVSQLT